MYEEKLSRPEKEDKVESRNLTLRLLVLADLAPGGKQEEVLGVDRNNLASVLESLAPRLEIEVKDRIGMGKKLRCSLIFRSMKDFQPDNIVAAVPILQSLVHARELLTRCLTHKKKLEDIRGELLEAFKGTDLAKALQKMQAGVEPSPEAGSDQAGGIESLLDQVELPKGETGALSADSLVEVFTALVAPGKKLNREGIEGLVLEIDRRLSRQVGSILGDPRFVELEATWRGLNFLVRNSDSRKGIFLEVLPVARERALEVFFEKIFHTEYDGLSKIPLNFVLTNFSFGRSKPDLDMLKDMAKLGAGLSVPFIGAMSPSFWGVRQASMLNKLPDLLEKIKASEYAKWRSFRREEESLWLAMVGNRFLLRPLLTGEGKVVRSFGWIAEESGEKPLYGKAVWAMGVALAQSFVEEGYRFPCAGRRSAGVLTDLPILADETSDNAPQPLEVLFGDRRAFELAECGFAPLMTQADSDAAYFNMVPSFHQAKRYEDEEATRTSYLTATLPYRGFAGAIAHDMDRIARTLGGGLDESTIVKIVREELLGILNPMEEGTPNPESIEVEVLSDIPELRTVFARLRPSFDIYGAPVDLIVSAAVPR